MINNDLPCIKDKCLKLPVCKHQPIIYCKPLLKYITANDMADEIKFSEWWVANINSTLLKVSGVGPEVKK